jgi:hypothetical protein
MPKPLGDAGYSPRDVARSLTKRAGLRGSLPSMTSPASAGSRTTPMWQPAPMSSGPAARSNGPGHRSVCSIHATSQPRRAVAFVACRNDKPESNSFCEMHMNSERIVSIGILERS